MSALAWVALAGWAVAVVCAWKWHTWCNRSHKVFRKFEELQDRCISLSRQVTDAQGERDWAEIISGLREQIALDDRAACDAMREELQRMRSAKR